MTTEDKGFCPLYDWCEGHNPKYSDEQLEEMQNWHTGWEFVAQSGDSELRVYGSIKNGKVEYSIDMECFWEIDGDEVEKEWDDLQSILGRIFSQIRSGAMEVTR